MRYLGLICARGGSKGVKDKNIRLVGDKPLIGISIEIAKKIKKITRILVSTDSKSIAKVGEKYGAEVPFIRPASLSQDDSPEWLVWRHAIEYLESLGEIFDGLVVLPPTAPLKTKKDILGCIHEYEVGNYDVVITASQCHRNPYFNMVERKNSGDISLVMDTEKKFNRRQDSPEVFDMTTVAYVVNPEFIKEKNGIFEGKIGMVEIPVERSIDIDTELDLKIANFLFNEYVNYE